VKRSPIARMSVRRRSELAERRQVVADVIRRDGGCLMRESAPDDPSGACRGPLDGHEVLPKGRGGDWLDRDNVVTLCRLHHDWVHGNPAKAERLGLLKRSQVTA
jgi:hypothetical protein